jgi:hypothetical protein
MAHAHCRLPLRRCSARRPPRSGRPPRVPIEIHQQLIQLACQRPADCKVPFEQVWTLHSLADALADQTGVRISRSEAHRILEGADLKPHRVRLWLHSPGPDFRPKVEAICELYLRPPEGATVLCVDEKPGMQALEHRFPMQPCAIGRAGRKEFEYIRHGIRTLLASYNIRTGEVLGHCGPTRSADDLLAFIEHIAAHYPTGPVYIIWDNLNIHHGPRWVHLWTLEIATHTGRWEKTGFRGLRDELLDLLMNTVPWTIAPID